MNGDLELPEALRPFVSARFVGRARILLAAGQSAVEDTFLVNFPFDGETVLAEATFTSATEILIGTGMLREYQLGINFPNRGQRQSRAISSFKIDVPAGSSPIGIPLEAGGNTVAELLTNVPEGTLLNVLADPVPEPVITGPQSIVALDIFSVAGTFTDAGTANGVYTVEWNFGDGRAVVTGTLTPTHEFESHGTYTVTLTVRDDHGGVGIATLEVTVMSAYGCAWEAQDRLKLFIKESKRIDRAVRDIGASLEPKLWIDEMHLNAKHGQKVFIKLRQAMKMLDDLIADPKDKKSRDSDFDREDDDEFKKIKGDPKKETLSAAAKVAVRDALTDLVCAARLVSETLCLENLGLKAVNPKNQKQVDQHLASAKSALEKAITLVEANNPVRAIVQYRKCWEETLAAIKDAAKK